MVQEKKDVSRISDEQCFPTVSGLSEFPFRYYIFVIKRLSRARDLDLGSGHTAYRHASLVNLYLHAKFH